MMGEITLGIAVLILILQIYIIRMFKTDSTLKNNVAVMTQYKSDSKKLINNVVSISNEKINEVEEVIVKANAVISMIDDNLSKKEENIKNIAESITDAQSKIDSIKNFAEEIEEIEKNTGNVNEKNVNTKIELENNKIKDETIKNNLPNSEVFCLKDQGLTNEAISEKLNMPIKKVEFLLNTQGMKL